MFTFISLIFFVILLSIWLFLQKKNQYWNGKGVPTPRPSLLLGNYSDYLLLKKNLGENVAAICAKFPEEPIIATYFGTEPAVIVKDPELLRLVFIKDFYYFNSRELADYSQHEDFYKSIFSEANDAWRALRQNFNPLFSPAKMKNMFHLIDLNTKALNKLIDEEMKITDIHDIKNLSARFTVACVGSCVFGIETKILDNSSEDNDFKKISNEIFNFNFIRGLKYVLRQAWPRVFYGLGLRATQAIVEDFFTGLLTTVFQDRKFQPGSRNDFVDYLLDMKCNGYITGDAIKNLKTKGDEKTQLEITDRMLMVQSMSFFAAGFETSASTTSLTLFELAKRPDALERVLQEVDEYLHRHNGSLSYECINELPYLEACVDETMRKYPTLGAITREVVEDYTLPSGVILRKGMRVFIPTYYMHGHPDYFPDPEEYKPERFLRINRNNIKPYTYFPFGEGPRICLGMRFARMQIYAGLVTILRRYRVGLPADQPTTVIFEPKSFVTQIVTPIKLQLIPR